LYFIGSRSTEKNIRTNEQTMDERRLLCDLFKIIHRPRKVKVPYGERSRFLPHVTLDDVDVRVRLFISLPLDLTSALIRTMRMVERLEMP
jgi:hypothetical protein